MTYRGLRELERLLLQYAAGRTPSDQAPGLTIAIERVRAAVTSAAARAQKEQRACAWCGAPHADFHPDLCRDCA